MKFERWNKDTRQFELVELKEGEFEELLLGFQIVECECLIEERIELLRFKKYCNQLGLPSGFNQKFKNIPKYD